MNAIDNAISILMSKNQSVFFENHQPVSVAPTKDILTNILANYSNNDINYNINTLGRNYQIVHLEKDEKLPNYFDCIIEHTPTIWPLKFKYNNSKMDVPLPWLYLGAKVAIQNGRFEVMRHPKMMYQVKICMSPNRITNIHKPVFGVPLPNMWQENYENGPWWVCTGSIHPHTIKASSISEFMKKLLYDVLLTEYSYTYIPSYISKNEQEITKIPGYPSYKFFNEWMEQGIFFGSNPDKKKWPILQGTMKEFINLWL